MVKEKVKSVKQTELAWLLKPMTMFLRRNVEDATARMFIKDETTVAREKKISRSFYSLLPHLKKVDDRWKDVQHDDLNTGTQPATKQMATHFHNIRKSEKQV